jgi:hypothetical protein
VTYRKQFSAKGKKTEERRTFKLVYYNFHQETVSARDCTVFHLPFFKIKDRNLTVQLLKSRGYCHQKAIHIFWFTMFIVENIELRI